MKRSTDYKQVYLVDSLYFRNCNQQNAFSNNQQVTLSTPKSNQFFNNHYNIPSSTSNECDCNKIKKHQPSFHNPRKYDKSNRSLHLHDPEPEYDFKNERDENDSEDEVTINPPDPFIFYDDNIQNNEQLVKEDRNSKKISNAETLKNKSTWLKML